jgi:membrane fusion protein (multidrug efflux system)
MTDAPVTAAPPEDRPKQGRRPALLLLAGVVLVGGLAWATYNFLFAGAHVATDDAYIGGDVAQVTSEVPGTVIALHADDTQSVHRDQLLVELDPANADVQMEAAKAGLAQAVRHIRSLRAQEEQLRAQIAAREADLRRAEDDTRRRAGLIATGAVSREDFNHAQDATAAQVAALAGARAQLEQILAQLGTTPLARQPEVLSAESQLRDAALALRRTRIQAPADGIVAQRNVEVGQHVDAGTPLMAVVPLGDVWVNANFKEVQLQHMRVGQKATVTTDIYGGKVTYHGKVAGLAAGSGNAFSLLPAQNATGNWIKIVQRLPVRILLDPSEIEKNPLRIGLSASVDIDVSDQSGGMIAAQVLNKPFPSKRSDGDDPEIDAAIAHIVTENDGAAEVAASVK